MIRLPLALTLLFSLGDGLRAEENLVRLELSVEGTAREALLHVPPEAKKTPSPLVFFFHGHGGTMRAATAKFGYHRLWPEAIVVYPQGLNTPGLLTDPEGKRSGWQKTFGDQGDRDLRLFDALLARLQRDCRVDPKRIYATGHSNGGAFSYLLWAARGDVFAALAPSAAAARPQFLPHFKPKPLFHMAGENDPLVRFEWQQRTIEAVRRVNGCGAGQPWGPSCTLYASKTGTPVVTYIHPGGHGLPGDVPAAIVRFFKEHAKP